MMLPPAALLDHLPRRRLSEMKHAGQVDRDDAVPSLGIEIEEIEPVADPGRIRARCRAGRIRARPASGRIDRRAVAHVESRRGARPPAARIRAAVASAAAPSLSVQNTAAPSRARASAPAPPMPPPAPATSATLPATRPMPPSRYAVEFSRQLPRFSLATSKLYTRAVLPPAILACSSSGTPGQDLRQDLPRLGKRRLAVRIVRAPHHVVDADDVAQANADGVLLEAQDDVAAEEVARAACRP